MWQEPDGTLWREPTTKSASLTAPYDERQSASAQPSPTFRDELCNRSALRNHRYFSNIV